jgi:hypothetical protein
MPLFHEFAARLPQSDSANEKQGEPQVIAVVLLILLGQKIRGGNCVTAICATD